METTPQKKVLWGLAAFAIIVYALVPIVWILSISLKDPSTIGDGRFIPSKWTLENYEAAFKTDFFRAALINSIGIALIATVLAILLASMAAYAITRLDFKGKGLILGGALAVSMFPPISIVGSLFNVWRQIGLFDTWIGLILPYLTFALPLAIYTLSAFFREIPWELEQAAQVDGATTWQAFRKAIVPLAAPGVFTTALIAFFIAWNDFVYGISLTSTSAARPVPAALAFFTGASQFEEPTGAISAAAVVVTVPVVILVLLFQRQIVSGLTQGAVKG